MRKDGILLLGGTGFIGTALAKRLARAGRPVHILARHEVKPAVAGAVMHCGGMDDLALLEKVLPECGTVAHLACTTTPGVSANRPALEASENLLPTLRLLEALQRRPGIHVVFLSSGGTLYGDPAAVPVADDCPPAPRSYFAAGKLAVEGFLQAFGAQGGRRVTILRPSNAYGPEQVLRPGFGIIRTMLEHLRLDTPMDIWGDGEQVRDFIYIDDLVDACCRVIEAPVGAGVYNLGSGTGFSLNQVRAVIEQVSGRTLGIRYRPGRAIDVRRIVLDSSRLIVHDDASSDGSAEHTSAAYPARWNVIAQQIPRTQVVCTSDVGPLFWNGLGRLPEGARAGRDARKAVRYCNVLRVSASIALLSPVRVMYGDGLWISCRKGVE